MGHFCVFELLGGVDIMGMCIKFPMAFFLNFCLFSDHTDYKLQTFCTPQSQPTSQSCRHLWYFCLLAVIAVSIYIQLL